MISISDHKERKNEKKIFPQGRHTKYKEYNTNKNVKIEKQDCFASLDRLPHNVRLHRKGPSKLLISKNTCAFESTTLDRPNHKASTTRLLNICQYLTCFVSHYWIKASPACQPDHPAISSYSSQFFF